MRDLFSVAVVGSIVAACLALQTTTGCSGCDLEHKCMINNNALVVSKVAPMCGAQPTGTGATRTWTIGDTSCTCDLTSNDLGQFFLRNCAYTPGKM